MHPWRGNIEMTSFANRIRDHKDNLKENIDIQNNDYERINREGLRGWLNPTR